MSLIARLTSFAQAVGADMKTLLANQGSLAALNTTAKTSLVAAINEVQASGGGGGVTILDTAGAGDTTHTWSADKSTAAIAAAITDLIGGASAALDTLAEIEAALGTDDTAINGLLTAVANRIRVDAAQTFSTVEQATACANIGVGDPETDLAAIYAAAKA